ncbi:MAG: recombination protein F [Leptolyngbya sp.]|nr:MAG: recombination protein F [Leptolyngbya sp.]
MRKLESIHFHQFRGIRDLRLENLGQVNLLVGINNSGKTSVLEGLSIYCHPLDLREWFRTARQREQESRLNQTSVLDSVRWLFPKLHSRGDRVGEPEVGTLMITGDGSFPVKKLQARYEVIEGLRISERRRRANIGRSKKIEDETSEIQKGIDLHLEIYADPSQLSFLNNDPPTFTQDFQLWEDAFIGKLPRSGQLNLETSIVTPSSHRSETEQFRLLSKASFHDFKTSAISLLRQVDPGITDIEILLSPDSISSSRFSAYIQHERFGLAPLSTFGDGIRRLLHIALKLASVQGGILLIDELEATIHTEALQNSFKWLVRSCKELDVQLFATTHSLEAVDALLEVTESESDLVLHRLEPKETHTRVVRHDWSRLKLLREELGQEVRW